MTIPPHVDHFHRNFAVVMGYKKTHRWDCVFPSVARCRPVPNHFIDLFLGEYINRTTYFLATMATGPCLESADEYSAASI